MTSPVSAIAALFDAGLVSNPNVAAEVYPGYPGLVVAEGQVRSMAWGFPLAQKSKRTGLAIKPRTVNNAREDKLATAFWRDSFVRRRCLIPVTAWAEAEGEDKRMTRTWYSLPGEEIFAVAGIWRPTDEWGNAYSMVMVDNCAFMAEVHDRMPTILKAQDWEQWTQGSAEEALALCRIWDGELIADRTSEPWYKPRGSSMAPSLL